MPMMPDPSAPMMPAVATPPAQPPADSYPGVSAVESDSDPLELAPSESDRERVKDLLLGLFEDYRSYRETEVEPIWNETYEAYQGCPPSDNYPYQSHYIVNETFRQCEVQKPMLASALMPDGMPFRRYVARRPEPEFYEKAEAATAIVKQHLADYGGDRQILRWLDNMTVWGTSYLYYGWQTFRHLDRKIMRAAMDQDKPAWKRVTTERLEDAPCVKWIDHWSVYTDWRVDDLRDSPVAFVVEDVTVEELKTRIREGWYDAALTRKAIEQHRSGSSDRHDRPDEQRKTDLTKGGPNKEGLLAVLTGYTNDGGKYTIIDNEYVVQAARNPEGRAPILTLKNYPQDTHYGLGEPAVMAWPQVLLNDTTSALMDTSHFTNTPMSVVAMSEKKNWAQKAYKPGGVVFMDDINNWKPFQTQPHTQGLINLADYVRRNIQLLTGNTDESQGITKHRTSSGIRMLQGAGQERGLHKIRYCRFTFRELVQKLYDLEARYLDSEMGVRLKGAKGGQVFKTYGPDAFDAHVDVEVELQMDEATPQERQAKAIQFYQLTMADPGIKYESKVVPLLKAFDIERPTDALVDRARELKDAQIENEEHLASGMVPDVRMEEDHASHIMSHMPYIQSDPFRALPPEHQQVMMSHLQDHLSIQQQMMRMAGQGAMMGAPEMNMSPVPAADLQTEAQFSNAQTGAQGPSTGY